MLNFSGQTRKRVVNLGDRRSNLTSRNFLEHNRQQRLERDQQRAKEKACALLKRNIVKYLAARRAADAQLEQWVQAPPSSPHDYHRWVVQLYVLAKWSFPFLQITHLQQIAAYTRQIIPQWPAAPFTNSLLVKALSRVLRVSANDPQVVGDVLICLEHVVSQPSKSYVGLLELLIPVAASDDEQTAQRARKVIFAVNIKDSVDSFVRFLASTAINDPSHYRLMREALSHDAIPGIIHTLSNRQKLAVLLNFLDVHGSLEFVYEDFYVLNHILSAITFSTGARYDDDDEDESRSNYLLVSSDEEQKLNRLYSSACIHQLLSLFRSDDNAPSHIAIVLLSSLFHLVPSSKTKLSMSITISPGAFKWFYSQLKSDPLYQAFEDIGTESGYVLFSDIKALYADILPHQVTSFWKTLYTFQEVYSYWLIVSNDLETFCDDKLTLEEVKSFLSFSKTLCLTLIFNSGHAKQIYEDFDQLKDISIALLNQLYRKNARLKFISSDLWKTNVMNINIETLTQILAEEEERLHEREQNDDSDDPMSDIKPMKKTKVSQDVSAKLEVLNKLPFFVEFDVRVKIFQSLIDLDKSRLHADSGLWTERVRLEAKIRREHVLEDAFHSFSKLGSGLKNRLSVTFFNKHNEEEVGIDGGGITKEFLSSVVASGFTPDTGLFKETPSGNAIYPNEDIYFQYARKIDLDTQMKKLQYLRFLGSVVGKCLYEKVLIDYSFAPFFLSKWCNATQVLKNSINDLGALDEELLGNLMKLTKMSDKEISALDLTFTVDQVVNDGTHEFELVEGGAQVKVTAANVLNYIHRMSNFKLNVSLHLQTKYFLEGLFTIISAEWLKLFDAYELQMLISGSTNKIDVEDWKSSVVYGNYFDDDKTILLFWEVVEEFSAEDRSKLLKYVTSSSKPPLLGFGSLNPKFGINNAGMSIDRLPTASTCVNLLKLPDYGDKKLIRDKILYAINVDAGFDLS